MFDTLLQGGRVIDPIHGFDGPADVAIADGQIAAIEPRLDGSSSRQTVDACGLIVTPGLIDLHVHLYWGVSHYGIDADTACLARGVTTAVDAGSAGALTYPGLKRWIMDASQTELYAFLNIAYLGMIGDQVGELEDLRFIDDELALRVGRSSEIVGIKVRLDRVGPHAATLPLRRALTVAERLHKPLMVHIGSARRMHVSLGDILEELRPGDIVTHMYHGKDGGLVGDDGLVCPAARAARRRGVLFDVGHGAGSYSFPVSRAALAQGFGPDVISSDLHTYSLVAPVRDLVTTLNKFLLLGLSLVDAIGMVTAAPARIIGQDARIGHLGVGAEADIALLRLDSGERTYADCEGNRLSGGPGLTVVGALKRGTMVGLGPNSALGVQTL
ncbi:MAG: amidohydrolase/deacetylase family metallohydrolase [Chloroflexi bacterium]|nr:amidohydrolase/deacetylase family metallohydrolase [Chloroflexota bacterium]